MMFSFSPLTQKKIQRFKAIKPGYWSFIILSVLLLLALFAEFFINSKALVVRYQGEWFFPVVSDVRPGQTLASATPVKPTTGNCSNAFRPKRMAILSSCR